MCAPRLLHAHSDTDTGQSKGKGRGGQGSSSKLSAARAPRAGTGHRGRARASGREPGREKRGGEARGGVSGCSAPIHCIADRAQVDLRASTEE